MRWVLLLLLVTGCESRMRPVDAGVDAGEEDAGTLDAGPSIRVLQFNVRRFFDTV